MVTQGAIVVLSLLFQVGTGAGASEAPQYDPAVGASAPAPAKAASQHTRVSDIPPPRLLPAAADDPAPEPAITSDADTTATSVAPRTPQSVMKRNRFVDPGVMQAAAQVPINGQTPAASSGAAGSSPTVAPSPPTPAVSEPTSAPASSPNYGGAPYSTQPSYGVQPGAPTTAAGSAPPASTLGVPSTTSTPAAAVPTAPAIPPSSAAADLLSTALANSDVAPTTGQPLQLVQLLGRTRDRSSQLRLTRSYWKLCIATAQYHWAASETRQLEETRAVNKAIDGPVLATAQASAQARQDEAKLNFVAAQQELADMLGYASTQPLPLCVDVPLVGAYRTYFDALFANQVPPPQLRLIDRSMPLRRTLIDTRAGAVQAASSAVRSVEIAHAKGEAPVFSLIAVQEELGRQRMEFLNAIRAYNYDIAEYALAVAPATLNENQLVGMMIRVRPNNQAAPIQGMLSSPAYTIVPGPGATMGTTSQPSRQPTRADGLPTASNTAVDGWSGVRRATALEDAPATNRSIPTNAPRTLPGQR